MTLEPRTAPAPVALDPRINLATDSWTIVLGDAIDLARNIAGTEFAPRGLQTVEKVTAAILYGRELDLPPMTALSSIHVVNGRPGISAELMRALILGAGHQLRIHELTEDRCILRGRRREDRDDPDAWQTFSFTHAQAVRAGLLKNDVWKAYPTDMLLARATARAARAMFSDAIHGLAAVEELRDLETTPTPPAPVVVQAPKRPRKAAAEVESKPTPPPPASAQDDDDVDVEVVDETTGEINAGTPAVHTAEPVMTAQSPTHMTPAQQRTVMGHINARLGVTDRNERLILISAIVGRPLATSSEITHAEASRLIDVLATARDRDDLETLITKEN